MPRLIGVIFDLIHYFGWMYYIRYLPKTATKTLEYGHCRFYLDEDNQELLENALDVLESRNHKCACLLKESDKLRFILDGNFPNYHREANLKVSIHKNTIKRDGAEGILAAIGYGLVLEKERQRCGLMMFHLFPPSADEIKVLWIGWMEENVLDQDLISFYRSEPMQ